MSVKLIWITPNTEELIASMARVSNPKNQDNKEFSGLLRYMIRHQHWSPFEMANAVFEINTTRDIARQILRHRSFSFQEFSQRYAEVTELEEVPLREARLQDTTNRQNSITSGNTVINDWWAKTQAELLRKTQEAYELALENGIAKEQARAILPEGLTPSRMYMNGTIRSWIHYTQLRTDKATQKEHRQIAEQINNVLQKELPTIWRALDE